MSNWLTQSEDEIQMKSQKFPGIIPTTFKSPNFDRDLHQNLVIKLKLGTQFFSTNIWEGVQGEYFIC